MARITAEDCSKVIPHRFQLVVYATRYAKLLNYKVETNHNKKEKLDKPPVIALRRIASGKVSIAQLEQDFINRLSARNRIEPLVEQDESEDSEEEFQYLPEYNIGKWQLNLSKIIKQIVQICCPDSSVHYSKIYK